MEYAQKILNQWKKFDDVLSRLPLGSSLYRNVYSIRNLYVAYQEVTLKKDSVRDLLSVVVGILRMIVSVFIRTPVFSNRSARILLEINKEMDGDLADRLNIPLGSIRYHKDLSFRNIHRVRLIYAWLAAALYLFKEKSLNRTFIIKTLQDMLAGIWIYDVLDLSGIEVIITQRDRYSVELAILTKAKEQGIKTIRIENYMTVGSVNRNTIFCDYYYSPNSINKGIFQSFKQNHRVTFVDGGFPYWDVFSQYSYHPEQHPRIISFWTQYGTEIGIYGPKGPPYYIKEILSVMPDDCILVIKAHPLDDVNSYRQFQSHRVRFVKHGEINNMELVARSSFVFSVSSQASIEAKHVCTNSFHINYEPAEMKDMSYDLFSDYFDLITNRDDLLSFLTGRRKPKDQQAFIRFFNPGYPNSVKRLIELVDSL